MAQQAKVTSIADLEAFRASLIRYIEHAKRALDEAGSEVRRVRGWLDHDRRRYWDMAVKKSERALEQAEQELYSASLSSVKTTDSFHKMAVMKARRRLAAMVEKRKLVKRWRDVFDRQTDPFLRQMEGMHDKVARELPEAVVFLSEAISNLEAYADSRMPTKRRPAAEVEGGTETTPAPEGGEEEDS